MSMTKYVEIDKLEAGALFKLVFLGTLFGLAPLSALASLLALFGFAPVSFAGVAYTGLGGFFMGLLMAPMVGLSLAGMAVFIVPFGWWVYGQFYRRSLRAVPKSSQD